MGSRADLDRTVLSTAMQLRVSAFMMQLNGTLNDNKRQGGDPLTPCDPNADYPSSAG